MDEQDATEQDVTEQDVAERDVAEPLDATEPHSELPEPAPVPDDEFVETPLEESSEEEPPPPKRVRKARVQPSPKQRPSPSGAVALQALATSCALVIPEKGLLQ